MDEQAYYDAVFTEADMLAPDIHDAENEQTRIVRQAFRDNLSVTDAAKLLTESMNAAPKQSRKGKKGK